jgi:hypothetical protein
MAAARIAAAILSAVLASQLAAQPAPQGHLTIQVVDQSGAVIPNARIVIDPALPQPESVLRTDSQGQASLQVRAGNHVLSIAAPGFETWSRQIDVRASADQAFKITLQVGQTGCGACVVVLLVPPMPNELPEPVFLTLEPLSNFAPLPSRPARKRW